jgi:RNA polymerase sigma-70 factor (ECF subfamily)
MQSTSPSLLQRLRQPSDHEAWNRFVQLYTPLLYHWLHQAGYSPSDADDLVQDVFTVLFTLMPRFSYDHNGSFRAWLRTVALNKWREHARKRRRATSPLDEGGVVDLAMADPAEQFWEQDHRGYLVRRALELMQTDFPERTWKACWRVVVEGKKAAEVAEELHTTVGAVHAARFRVLARLREELADLMS